MAVSDASDRSSRQPGSILEISQRLALWARRNPQGLVRAEYSAESARQRVVQQLNDDLSADGISVQDILLPTYQTSDTLVGWLLETMQDIAGRHPGSIVSIAGFSTAFNHQESLPEALRVVNFNRARFAAFPLKQIWWMTPVLLQVVVHAMPDLNSWFVQRLHLTETVLDPAPAGTLLPMDDSATNIDDARQRAHQLIRQFQTAQQAGAADDELLATYLLPSLEALADANSQKELRELTGQFEGFLGSLKLSPSLQLSRSLDRLARIYHKQGRYGEAEPLYKRSLSIREQQLGPDHPDVATSLNNLALLYESMGRYGEAEPLVVRSLSIYEQQLGPDHPDVATSLNNLALLYRSMGRYGEAEPLVVRSLAIREQQLGADHPDVATSLNNLAELYRSMGRYGEAEPVYARSLSIYEQQLGPDHPSVATSLNNLANLYYSMGRYGEAEPLVARSLAIREQQLGADHPDVAQSLNNLAGLYSSMGRYGEAEPLLVRSLSIIYEQQLGADHPHVATSLWNIAALYLKMQRLDEAKPAITRAVQIFEKALGHNHPNTVSALQWWQMIHNGSDQ